MAVLATLDVVQLLAEFSAILVFYYGFCKFYRQPKPVVCYAKPKIKTSKKS